MMSEEGIINVDRETVEASQVERNRPRCKDCRHWWHTPLSNGQGQCRLNGPAMFPVNGPAGINFITTWPATKDDQGCSSYKPEDFTVA